MKEILCAQFALQCLQATSGTWVYSPDAGKRVCRVVMRASGALGMGQLDVATDAAGLKRALRRCQEVRASR
jgi:hypothetical protein